MQNRTFQSSAAPKGGCNRSPKMTTTHRSEVSILSRPEGRLQPRWSASVASPSTGFNPQPPRRAAATT